MMRRKCKVLFVTEAMGGGLFTYIVDLANELVNTFDMYVAYAVRKQTPSDFKDYFDERIHLIEVRNFVRSISPSRDIKAFFEIRKIACKVQPDIIHLHSSKAGALGRWAFNGRKIPLFYTPNGYSFLMQNCSGIKRALYKGIEIMCGWRSCMTISCSEGEHKETLKLTKCAAYVNNGINVKKLEELICSIGSTKKEIFTVFTHGRICSQKNPKLFNRIALAMPDVQFMWIGDGELREELSAPNIRVTGWVERRLALQYSMQGDVFMLTSLWEGLPLSLLEAMYMRKLCIVSDTIGNRDVIHSGYNGYVCRKIDEFVKAIRKAQDEDISELLEKAYSDIICVYNTDVMSEKYSEIYIDEFNSKKSGGVQHKISSVLYSDTAFWMAIAAFREMVAIA